MDVAANETVVATAEVDGNRSMSERLRRLEDILESYAEKPIPRATQELGSTNGDARNFLDPSSPPYQAERGSNIRWDLIPKFPKDVPSNKLWEYWQSFIDNFQIAASLSTFTGPSDRAKLLYLSMGKELQDIVNAANLQPDYRDKKCYSELVDRVSGYFKSMTDTSAEHEAFQAMRQTKSESIVSFHARLTQKVRLCGYSPADQTRFVLAQLLKGMQNRELAKAARTYGYDASYVVQAATRVEAYEAGGPADDTSHNPPDIFAVNQRSTTRGSQGFPKTRMTYDTRYGQDKKVKVSEDYRQGRRSRCWRCGFLFHKNTSCPALDKPCNTCGRIGHFAVTCRRSSGKTRIDNSQETSRKHSTRGWKKDPNDEQV